MSLRVEQHCTIYRDPAYYCGPGPAAICDPQTGRITVTFRRVPSWLHEGLSGHWHPATELCLTHSDDDGRTWSPAQVYAAGAQCPNLRRLRDGTWLMHTHRFELVNDDIFQRVQGTWPAGTGGAIENNWPGLQRGTGIWRSTDEGITWGDPVWLAGAPDATPLHPSLAPRLAVRGNLLETASGELLVSAYSFGETNTSHLFASADGGVTWDWRAAIADDMNETYLHETDGGDIVAFLRCHSTADDLHSCRSADGGQTWSPAKPVCRGYPACAATLPSGRHLLAYGYRFDDGYGTRARWLEADGQTLTGEEIVLREDGAASDLGYPDATGLPDGRVLVVFYHTQRDESVAMADPKRATRFIAGCVVSES